MQVEAALRGTLKEAMRARDDSAVSALRSALARLDNAGAVEAPTLPGTELAIEYTPSGLGAAEQSRRMLTESEAVALVQEEAGRRRQQAMHHQIAGRPHAAAGQLLGAELLESILGRGRRTDIDRR